MKQMSDQFLDQLIGEHVKGELDPHLGKSAEYFDRIAEGDVIAHSPWRRAMGSIVALAASIMVAWLAFALYSDSKHTQPQDPMSIVPDAPPMAIELERTVMWREFDEGTVMLENNTPARRIRRQSIERVQWYDPTRGSVVEVTKPEEEVILIEMMRF